MNWRQQLDARIDTCPDCDQYRWDRECSRCDVDKPVDNGLSHGEVIYDPEPDGRGRKAGAA